MICNVVGYKTCIVRLGRIVMCFYLYYYLTKSIAICGFCFSYQKQMFHVFQILCVSKFPNSEWEALNSYMHWCFDFID